MSDVHIEVMAYRGKTGSYANTRMPLWMVWIVGTDGTKRRVDQSSWHGIGSVAMAEQWAADWAAFLGVPVVRVTGEEKANGGVPD